MIINLLKTILKQIWIWIEFVLQEHWLGKGPLSAILTIYILWFKISLTEEDRAKKLNHYINRKGKLNQASIIDKIGTKFWRQLKIKIKCWMEWVSINNKNVDIKR